MLHTSPWSKFELTTSVMIGTDCIGSCISNYHTITATLAHKWTVVQRASTIKSHRRVLAKYKADIISIKSNLFSSWYSCNIPHSLTHSLTHSLDTMRFDWNTNLNMIYTGKCTGRPLLMSHFCGLFYHVICSVDCRLKVVGKSFIS
jgi:hypothetical protein